MSNNCFQYHELQDFLDLTRNTDKSRNKDFHRKSSVVMDTNVSLENLILDFLEWLATRPRPYAEVMNTWKTSCPMFPVWEEAVDRGFVVREDRGLTDRQIAITTEGIAHLRALRPGQGDRSALPRFSSKSF